MKKRQLIGDWFHGDIPENVEIGRDVHIDSSHAFDFFLSRRTPGLILDSCCGLYYPSSIVVGPSGFIRVGEYTCINGTFLACNKLISIGAHCLLSWGVVITDSEPNGTVTIRERRQALTKVAEDADRGLPNVGGAQPVTIKDNVWIGFDSVVLPGVTIGRGSIVGCKSVITEDVPSYSVAVGNPARVVRHLEPSDTECSRQKAFKECLRA